VAASSLALCLGLLLSLALGLGACVASGSGGQGDGSTTNPAPASEDPELDMQPILRPSTLDPQLVGAGAWLDGVRYPSLRAALLVATEGTLIELEPGVHPGPVELTLSVQLKPHSADDDVIIDSRSPVALRVRAGAEVSISHILLRTDGPPRSSGDAAIVVQNATLIADACRITARRAGGIQALNGKIELTSVFVHCEQGQTAIMVSDGSVARMHGCTVETGAGIGSGVEVWESECRITGGRIQAATAGLVAGSFGRLRADDVDLKGTGAACLVDGTLELFACEISQARRGVSVRGAVRLTGCQLLGNDTALLMAGEAGYLTLSSMIFSGNNRRLEFVEGAEPSQVDDRDAPR